jgi:hypothetical protein
MVVESPHGRVPNTHLSLPSFFLSLLLAFCSTFTPPHFYSAFLSHLQHILIASAASYTVRREVSS